MCLKRLPLKITFRNNGIYNVRKAEDRYYDEQQEPKEKDNSRVNFNMNINEQK